jgi:hypothetical protein
VKQLLFPVFGGFGGDEGFTAMLGVGCWKGLTRLVEAMRRRGGGAPTLPVVPAEQSAESLG